MTDLLATYQLSRGRFDQAVLDLNEEQLNWRLHRDALTIGEMALHIAGVEVGYTAQMKDQLAEQDEKLAQCATEGVVNDNAFPYDRISPELVKESLGRSKQITEEILSDPEPYRAAQVQSALGPVIDGTGVCARFAFHPAYHHGQVWLIRTSDGFPS